MRDETWATKSPSKKFRLHYFYCTYVYNHVKTTAFPSEKTWEEIFLRHLRAGVGSVEQLDRVFVSEAFRQADFDCSGGIDCMEPLGLQPRETPEKKICYVLVEMLSIS